MLIMQKRLGIVLLFAGCTYSSPLIIDQSNRLAAQTFTTFTDTCPQGRYVPPSPGLDYFDTLEFQDLSVYRLSHAVRHPTMMYDDMGDPEPKHGEDLDPRWASFIPFHDYLQETYPLVHERLQLEKVRGFSLLFTLQGTNPDLKPLLLAAHQDVVTATTALDRWEYPPFDGQFDGEWVWGRGASDCKSNIIGYLSVLERLLETGFIPQRTLVLAFGQDEEATGRYGAATIATVLERRYGKRGFEFILDEGGNGLDDSYGPLMALPALAEKGYADLRVVVRSEGGHSSVPQAHTSIGYLARFITAVEDASIYRPVLTKANPYYAYLKCLSGHGDPRKIPSWLDKALAEGDLVDIAEKISAEDLKIRYMLQTSKASTVVHGGVKNNALPEEAAFIVNSRIQVNSSVAEHLQIILEVVKPIAKEYDLALTAFGHSISNASAGSVDVSLAAYDEPSPITPHTTTKWLVFSSAVRSAFGHDTIAAPSLATSNTDTRHYWNLTDSIFRWTPARSGTRLNAHTVNERIKIRSHIEAVKFYHELILHMDGYEGEGEHWYSL